MGAVGRQKGYTNFSFVVKENKCQGNHGREQVGSRIEEVKVKRKSDCPEGEETPILSLFGLL